MKIEQTLKGVRIATKKYFLGMILSIVFINILAYYATQALPKLLWQLPALYVNLVALLVASFFEMWLIFVFCELLESVHQGKQWSVLKTIIVTFLRLPKAVPMMAVIILFTIIGSAFYVFPGVIWFIFTAFSYQIYYFKTYKDLDAIKYSFNFVIKTGAESITLVSVLGILVYLSSYGLGGFTSSDGGYIDLVVACLNGIVAAFSYLMMTQYYILNRDDITF